MTSWPCPTCSATIELSTYLVSRMKVLCMNPILECEYCGEYIQIMLTKPPVYPMTSERKMIQIDCRFIHCRDHRPDGNCANEAPAITLNQNETVVCWSKKEDEEE